MKKILITFVLTLIGIHTVSPQVGIGTETPAASAQLELKSTTKGFLPPRMTEDDRDQISIPAQGLMIYCTDCGINGQAQLYNGDAWVNLGGGDAAAGPRQIGDFSDGGVVFYVAPTPIDLNGDGILDSGLLCAVEDQSSVAKWGCHETEISGADGTAIGTGAANTIAILAGCNEAGIAAKICKDYSVDGYNDWFLPSKAELNLMYQNIGQGNAFGLGNIGSFASDFYWSSSENNNNGARDQTFANSEQNFRFKFGLNRVRAARTF